MAYEQDAANFIAGRAFGKMRVGKQSDKYYIFDKDYWFRTDAAVRGPGAESVGSGYKLSNATYICEVYGLHTDVDDQTRRNADAPINLDRHAVEYVTNGLLLKREKQFVAAFIGASAWSTTSTPSTTWDDVSSIPIENVRAQANVIAEKTGKVPNTLIVGAEVHKRLMDHPDIVDRIKYGAAPGSPAIVTAQALASLFEVERYLVHRATENTAAEQATGTYDWMGNSGKNALLCYSAPNPGWRVATAAVMFEWMPLSFDRFRMQQNKADRIEGEEAYDFKVTGDDLAVEFTGAVAS
jgi:hypothetical protein